ncbi:DUF4012 domain-containing protein [Candidatus Daviesbacteria bacterium]|nr:DUF4012 domain-containing protein [Candidatus Daviesbacteria bacterium]
MNLNKRIEMMDSKARYNKSNINMGRKRSRKLIFLRVFIILSFLFVAIYLPIRGVYSGSRSMVASAKAIQAAAKNENLDDIRKNLEEMKKSAGGMNMSLNFLFWLRIIPFVGGYYADAKHFAKAAEYELDAAKVIADSLDPYKNELGFTGQPTPGQDRVAQLVKILDKVLPQIDKVEPQLKKAREEVKSIDVNKYPQTLGGIRLKSRIDTARNFIIGAHYAVTEAKPALEIAPSALGEPIAKNYLIIFQNDKELRATGGFMTAYAYLKLDKGRVSSSSSDDIYRLDEKLLSVCLSKICPLDPPLPIVKYLPEATGKQREAWSMRDSNLSPDLPTSMRDFEKMYQMLGEGLPFDGIIMIDTHVVEELIKITGPVEVFGTTYSAELDKRCNCPNVIYELENYAQIVQKGEKDRKAILGTLMQQILARSLGSSTDKMPEFINSGVKLAIAKNVMFYLHDSKAQDAFSKLNWTGEIKGFKGDYLHINDSNFAGGKSNLYVTEEVSLDINLEKGKVKNKLTINYKNPQKYSTWLNGRNRDYVRIYVPQGAKLLDSKGSDVPVTTIEKELGKTVFESFIEIRPQNSRVLSFEYELPSTFSDKEYPILIQKQPGTKDFKYEIKINGKSKEKFELNADKELILPI